MPHDKEKDAIIKTIAHVITIEQNKTTEISGKNMKEIHDLISEINKNSIRLERDVRNLNNLIHVVMGEGIRFPEYSLEE